MSADAWSVIASPFLPKYLSSPRCAALHGALYLVGDNTKKVYVYDPGANLWQKVSHPCPWREQAWGVGPAGAGERGWGLQTQGPRAPPSRGPGGAGPADALSQHMEKPVLLLKRAKPGSASGAPGPVDSERAPPP